MNVFQYISIGVLGLLTAFSIWAMLRGRARPAVAIGWVLVWLSTLVAILFPEAVTSLARNLGIQRGADLVLYAAVLAGLMGFFFLLTKFRATQRQITLLTRRIAIYDAESKAAPGGEGAGTREGDGPGEGGH